MEHMPVRINVILSATTNEVWKAITLPEALKTWFAPISDFELKEGKIFTFHTKMQEKSYLHSCKILEIVPHQKFRYSWTYPEISHEESVVTWDVVSEGDNSTRLFLTHEGVENFLTLGNDFTRENFLGQWTEILHDVLKPFIEKHSYK